MFTKILVCSDGSEQAIKAARAAAEIARKFESKVVLVSVYNPTQVPIAFVGVPAVDRLIRLSWQAYPQMQVNADFVKQIEDSGIGRDTEILCICRSGARSANAAAALTKAGFTNCWNVAQGFEGDRDGQGHRGRVGGWKAAGLPWIQS